MVIMNGIDIVERPVRLGRWVLMVVWCMVLLAAATPGAAEEIVVRLDHASTAVLEAAAQERVEAVIWHGERKPLVAPAHRVDPGQAEWVVHHPWQHGHQLVLRSRAAVSLPVDIDVFQGVIDGQMAVGFWPPCEGAVPAACSPAGITVHLATGTDWTDELVHPAGKWLLLPKGVFRYWLEAPGLVSAPPSYMAFGPASGNRGLAIVSRPLVPAGQVVLAPEHAETPDPVVQFLEVTTGFQRWVTGEGLHRPVQLPAGEVVALLGDFAHRRLTAVSRPRELSPGGLTVVDPTPPEPPDSDLVALVTNTSAPFDPESEIHISFTPPEGAPIPPDVTVVEHTTLLAIWYGRRERRGSVVVAPAGLTRAEADVTLPPGAMESVVLRVRALPSLEVVLSPFSWPDDPGGSAVVVRLPPMGPPRTLQVVGGDGEPCRWARVVLWVAGHRLSPGTVSWLTRAPGTDHLGRWSATGLPADTLEVVAWRPDPVLDRRGAAGEFDSQRTPWDVATATALRIRAAGE